MGKFADRLIHAINVFTRDPDLRRPPSTNYGTNHGSLGHIARTQTTRVRIANERSLLESIYSTIANDSADVEFRHIDTDENGNYIGLRDSGLQYCFSKSANLDQAPRALRRDLVMTLLHVGHAAVVPVKTKGEDPLISDSYDVLTMRVGVVEEWYPHHVRVRLYNDNPDKGIFESLTVPKRVVAIIENPFYSVMNEQNSTLQRIIRKLNLLDITDEDNSSGRMEIIIQLPHTLRTDAHRAEAENRRSELEFQLSAGKYGIAYIDATEKITQLNRPIENNLWPQIEGLMKMLFSQLGVTEAILNGSAEEAAMSNYNSRTIEPIIDAISEEFERKFLSRTATSQGQAIRAYRDPFKLAPLTQLSDLFDVLSRNEIMSPNEIRTVVGLLPSQEPQADSLNNRNMPDDKKFIPEPKPAIDMGEVDDKMKELGV